jgi:hypothetical protein
MTNGITESEERIAQRVAEILRPEILKAIAQDSARTVVSGHKLRWLVRVIQQASKYAQDARYGAICARGLMPHTKLLILSRLKAQEFRALVEAAIEQGAIAEVRDDVSGLNCYRLAGQIAPHLAQITAPQQPAYFVQEIRPEDEQDDWDKTDALLQAKLKEFRAKT